jgi:hypothetical protein
MYQLVKFDEKRWGVKRPVCNPIWHSACYDVFIEPKYKPRLFRAPEVVGSIGEWSGSHFAMKYGMMPEADARKLCQILNKEIQDGLDEDALFNGATTVACDNPVGANSGSN